MTTAIGIEELILQTDAAGAPVWSTTTVPTYRPRATLRRSDLQCGCQVAL